MQFHCEKGRARTWPSPWHRSNRYVVRRVSNENPRRIVFLAAEFREVKLPQVLESVGGIDHLHNRGLSALTDPLSITATCGPIVLTNTVFRLGSEIPAGKGRLDHLSGGRDNGYIHF